MAPLTQALLEPAPSPAEQDDRSFFLDHRRSHRLRLAPEAGPEVVAVVRRDGARHLLTMPPGEVADLTSPGFAARLFELCEAHAKTAEPKPRRRSFFARIFNR